MRDAGVCVCIERERGGKRQRESPRYKFYLQRQFKYEFSIKDHTLYSWDISIKFMRVQA